MVFRSPKVGKQYLQETPECKQKTSSITSKSPNCRSFFVLQWGEVQILEKLDVLSNKIDNALAIVKIFGSRVIKP